MSQAETNIDIRLQSLLEIVERNRDERCEALLREAREQAQQLIKHAHRDARKRMHSNVQSTREDVRQRLAAAAAQRQTRDRLHRQDADRALLERAWLPLNEQLLQRWQQAETRQQWVDMLIRQATESLIATPWRIEHPTDWPDTERVELLARLMKTTNVAPEFFARSDITAGLRICAGEACVDGTRRGLLRSRSRIEGIMLAALNDCRARHRKAES